MGSGKSYEVVSEVIVPAIAKGRRVVTNVDGISNDLVRQYVADIYKRNLDALGEIVHVTNEDVFKADFFPYYDDKKAAHTNTIVQPGDLVCIDEAWRFWPASGGKILPQHKSFFLEHRHFTHPATDVACDLVLMIQDMGTLNRFVKNVVAFNARTHKKISLGMPNTYSISLYEGSKQSRATLISNSIRKYRKEIYPLYSSFKGGAEGKSVNVDKRQNMFSSKRLIGSGVLVIFIGSVAIYFVSRFFSHKPSVSTNTVVTTTPATSRNASTGSSVTVKSTIPSFSTTWRIVGTVHYRSERFVVIADSAGRLRYESPSMFQQNGRLAIGDIDGNKVTYYSGDAPVVTHQIPKEGKK